MKNCMFAIVDSKPYPCNLYTPQCPSREIPNPEAENLSRVEGVGLKVFKLTCPTSTRS